MTKDIDAKYFFVPLGRERGGYLDLLKLPPTANLAQVINAENMYINELEGDFKIKKRKPLKESLKLKKITQEEFDEQVKVWKDEKTQATVELNKLKGNFRKAMAEKRKLANQGIQIKDHVWQDIHLAGKKEDLISHLATMSGPLERITSEQLETFINSMEDKGASQTITDLHQEIKSLDPSSGLYQYLELINCLKFYPLLWADATWESIDTPHRSFWAKQIKKWEKEPRKKKEQYQKQLSCRQVPMPPGPRKFNKYPLLSEPTDLSVERLEIQEIEDTQNLPERKGDKQGLDLQDLLGSFLKKEAAKNKEKAQNTGDVKTSKSLPDEAFMDLFMELLVSKTEKNI